MNADNEKSINLNSYEFNNDDENKKPGRKQSTIRNNFELKNKKIYCILDNCNKEFSPKNFSDGPKLSYFKRT